MALYTETLAEYLTGGGTLPSESFALMGEDFESIFIGRFAGLELGFETEELFAMRLANKAAIVCPEYAERLEPIARAKQALNNPQKWRHEQREYGEMHSTSNSDGTNTDLPYEIDTAKPSALSHLESDATTDEHSDVVQHSESISVDENLKILESLNRKAFLIVEACLNEFKPLFMEVY